MTKLKEKNGNKIKPDNFPLDIFKSDVISFLTNTVKMLQ